MKKIISILLAVLLLFTLVAAIGCSSDDTEGGEETMSNKKYTEYDLFKNGNTEYTIVIPKNADTDILTAASEITLFFSKSNGCNITTKIDENFQHFSEKVTDNSKFIILGDTSIDETAYGIDKSTLPPQGYIVKNVKSNVFIVGADSLGVLYGAYEFLNQTIEFETYAADEFYYIQEKDLKLCELNITDSPDFKFRYPNYGPLRNEQVANRFRINRERDIWIRDEGNFIHNAQEEYLPQSKYFKLTENSPQKDKLEKGEVIVWEDNPANLSNRWYANDLKQLCYTAHGDAEQVAEMQKVVIARMKELITYFYDMGEYRGSLSFTQEDGVTWCDCDACKANLETYGTNAASIIKFLNPVAEAIDAFMKEPENVAKWGEHSLDIVFFAYSKTEGAPVKMVNGEYVPVDDTVICKDNLAFFNAPIYANYTYDFNHPSNAKYLENMKKWQVVCKKMYLWTYSDTFPDYMCPYDTFSSMQSIYRMAKENNAYLFFDQSRFEVTALTGFDHLKIYLNSKLAWNVDEDYQALIDNWFDNYFKAASEPMRKIFEGYRSWMLHLLETTNVPTTTGVPYMRAEDWPRQLLNQWEKNIEEAYKSIEYLKQVDGTLYDKLYDRICTESIWIRFQIIEMHGDEVTEAELLQRKLSFKEDADRLGFIVWQETNFTDKSYLTDKYAEWGI